MAITLNAVEEKRERLVLYVANPTRSHEVISLMEDELHVVVDSPITILKAFREQTKPVFILVDSYGRWACYGFLAMLLFRVPIVLRLRGDFFSEEKLRRRDLYRHIKWLRYYVNILLGKTIINLAKGIVYNSKYLMDCIPVSKEKFIAIVHNPLHVPAENTTKNTIKIKDESFVLLTVTNFSFHDKVMPVVEEIIKLPKKRWQDWNLIWYVCGDGPLRAKIQKMIDNENLSDYVKLVGYIKNITAYYRMCHVYAHFTRMDAFPNATLEAMYFKKPIIINQDSCGTVEQINDGENGFIVGGGVSLEHVLSNYKANKELRVSHGEAGYIRAVTKFSIENQRKRFSTVIDHFVSAR